MSTPRGAKDASPASRGPFRLDDAAISRGGALAALRRAFTEAGLDTPALDARVLTAAAAELDPAALLTRPEAPLGREGAERLEGFARRRLAREPIARILGSGEFWSLRLSLSPATLVPRPDTETVVETALDLLPDLHAPMSVLDLGTGSGCILLAMLTELPQAWGVGVDRNPATLAAAACNAATCGLSGRSAFLASDWAGAIDGRFDLVVSNPPYIATGEIAALEPEVTAHDPWAALDGGLDGLAAYRAILADLARLLREGGLSVLEIGAGQAQDVARIVEARGLMVMRVARDLAGRDRAVAIGRPL